jgi:hypothetical protein
MPTDHYRSNPINVEVLFVPEIYYLWHATRTKVDLIFYRVSIKIISAVAI